MSFMAQNQRVLHCMKFGGSEVIHANVYQTNQNAVLDHLFVSFICAHLNSTA